MFTDFRIQMALTLPPEGVRRSSWVFWIAGDALRTKMAFPPEKSFGFFFGKKVEKIKNNKNHQIFIEIFEKSIQNLFEAVLKEFVLCIFDSDDNLSKNIICACLRPPEVVC